MQGTLLCSARHSYSGSWDSKHIIGFEFLVRVAMYSNTSSPQAVLVAIHYNNQTLVACVG